MDQETIDYEDVLRRLTMNDPEFVSAILAERPVGLVDDDLGGKEEHLVRLAALIALGAGSTAFDAEVAAAIAAGASRSEIVAVLLQVGPFVGSARLVDVAPRVADAIGFDVFSDLERLPSERG